MPVKRHFLGWDEPVAVKVRRYLLPVEPAGVVSLERDLILVPTRQAGRRLLEALARHCGRHGTALLSPAVEIPSYLTRSDVALKPLAPKALVRAVWARVLLKAPLGELGGLFPASVPERDFSWALQTGELLAELCDELAEGGLNLQRVCAQHGAELLERDRWSDLARLEALYLSELESLGVQDPNAAMLARAEQPLLPDAIDRVVLAAVPDPTPVTLRALDGLGQRLPLEVLVHAPQEEADGFDAWGRPLSGYWTRSDIPLPAGEEDVLLASSPVSQGRIVLEKMAEEAARFAPADFAVGVPDREVVPYVRDELERAGLPVYDPAGTPLIEHPLYQLLQTYADLVREGRYGALSDFLRHSDVLEHLQSSRGISPERLLCELDALQNACLPPDWESVSRQFDRRAGEEIPWNEALGGAVDVVRQWLARFEREPLDVCLRGLLQDLYASRVLQPSRPADDAFLAAAGVIDERLQEFQDEWAELAKIDKRDVLQLLMRTLAGERYFVDRPEALVDLEGWLELPWNDAPFLVVTGFNEGAVPDGRVDDVFLPDSLRVRLGLRHDASRLGRDAYLMRALAASRQRGGRICFIAGKWSARGEPLRPSRLLFHCGADVLPGRAERLFGDAAADRASVPATVGFRLDPSPPAGATLDPPALHVTAFRDYLECPFRFYLKHVLGMDSIDDEKAELDALDFGELMHHALQQLAGEEDEPAASEDSDALAERLTAAAERWVTRRFGGVPLLPVSVQLEAAKQRLQAAARVQAELYREGWRILATEVSVEGGIAGMPVRGKIDRIDRDCATGRIRILDYKTSDRASNPSKTHLGPWRSGAAGYAKHRVGRQERKWQDLQLPLYRLLRQDEGHVEVGYFNLPKAVHDTGVALWEGFSAETLKSARSCAEGVVRALRSRMFWPPADRVLYEPFDMLFPFPPADCFDPAPLMALAHPGDAHGA